jgi:hypothetical protein
MPTKQPTLRQQELADYLTVQVSRLEVIREVLRGCDPSAALGASLTLGVKTLLSDVIDKLNECVKFKHCLPSEETGKVNIYFSDFDEFDGLKGRLNQALQEGSMRVSRVTKAFLEVTGEPGALRSLYTQPTDALLQETDALIRSWKQETDDLVKGVV